ncbi:GntR family transcriptional regulator [Aliiroseovarius sp. KMU-50]|uniref:GntR family transcriptional regulator n=1 Tax=Aliiroseovarius salicola TaxID=3009082 RepID=A0ABT4VZH9_9RHOB|nr:GntR family transcriptional regulator [Aliiroseovarius sp. KMU-50]MDA5093145.1 GntR family transcriptional regulator [Aliiroseovarius sp. KMU-50]
MQLKSVDISKTASAASIIFDALKKAIIEGDLEEGAPLRQDEIARMFNTSRIPVREAISRLEEHGLVKSQRYKGAVVSGLSAEEAGEIFDYRSLLEPHVIRTAVPRMTPEILAKARGYLEAFAKSDDPMAWGNLNRKFHATLYNASDLSFHLEAIESALDRVDRYLRAQLVLTDGMARANDEHAHIQEACERGDADLAAELTQQHILGAKDSLLKHLSKM